MSTETKPKVKAPVKSKPVKAAASHSSYPEMIAEAITSLKERTGSSLPAIKKFVGAKHKDLPSGWEKRVNLYLRKLVDSGKIKKIKGSFKLGEAVKKAMEKPLPKKAASAPKDKSATKSKKATTTSEKKGATEKKAAPKKSSTKKSPPTKASPKQTGLKKTPIKRAAPKKPSSNVAAKKKLAKKS